MVRTGLPTKSSQYMFVSYTTYLLILWTFLNYGGKGADPYTGGGIRWFLITIPLFIYILINLALIVKEYKIKKDRIIIFLGLYLLSSFLTSVVNFDIKHFSETLRWALPIICIVHFRVYFPLRLINGLYLFALLFLIFTFDPQVTDYGYLPGQTTVNLHQGMWWRVSIWKYLTPPYSAAFSLIVFFANYFLNKSKSRYLFYIISIYFIILSGNRTSYLIFVLCLSLVFVFDKNKFGYNRVYCILPVLSLAIIFGLQLASDIIPLLGIQNEFFNSAILRSDSANADAQNLSSRFLIILEHFRLMGSAGISSIVGIGSDIYISPYWTVNGGTLGGSTDSYLTHLLARDGISFLFLLFSFISFFIVAMRERNLFAYIILISLLLYTVGYGAWLNLTSPVFLIFLGCLYQQNNPLTKPI